MILKKREAVVTINKIRWNRNENFRNFCFFLRERICFKFPSENLKQVLECDIVYRNKCPIWGG